MALPRNTNKNSSRIQIIDALRGLSVILMVAYHIGYNLYAADILPERVLYNPILSVLHPIFAGLFLVLAGVSSRFSHSNLKRCLITLACALTVTVVSVWYGEPIYMGILHLMTACILLYWLLSKTGLLIPGVLLAAFIFSYLQISYWPDLPSADYFPIIPWGFLFFFGVYIGGPIKDRKFPKWFYNIKIPLLPAVGRHTLVIYMLHQPVLYGIMWLLGVK